MSRIALLMGLIALVCYTGSPLTPAEAARPGLLRRPILSPPGGQTAAGDPSDASAGQPPSSSNPLVSGADSQSGTVRQASYDVQTMLVDWVDQRRQRSVPAKIYYPANAPGPFPVIIFSHGLGFTREDYAYLGQHWASQGYVSVHVQHLGSDRTERERLRPKESLRHAFEDPHNTFQRAYDISFAIDQVHAISRSGTLLAGKLDLAHVGVAGHAFGSLATLVVAGQVLWSPEGKPVSLADPRVRAVVAMSTPVPSQKETHERIYRPIQIPCLHMTGTKDDSPIGVTKAPDRRLPFDHMNAADAYLITYAEADHMSFLDHKLVRRESRNDLLLHELIKRTSTLFWNAYLRDDPRAKAALAQGGLSAIVGASGTVEQKLKPQTAARQGVRE